MNEYQKAFLQGIIAGIISCLIITVWGIHQTKLEIAENIKAEAEIGRTK